LKKIRKTETKTSGANSRRNNGKKNSSKLNEEENILQHFATNVTMKRFGKYHHGNSHVTF